MVARASGQSVGAQPSRLQALHVEMAHQVDEWTASQGTTTAEYSTLWSRGTRVYLGI